MLKSILSRAAVVTMAAMFFAGAAYAQSTVLVVDSQKVLKDSNAGKSVYSQLKSIESSIKSEAQSTMSPLDSEKKSIEAQTAGMTMEALRARPDLTQKIKSFQEKGAKAQLELRYKSAEMQATERKALIKVSKKIDEVIQALAVERRATVVLDKSMMLYTNGSADVTQEVINRMNRQMPSVAVTRERLPRKS